MKRIVEEYGGDLVVATLCLVETSRFGLLETELLDLLAIQPIMPGAKNVENLAVGGKLLMAKVKLTLPTRCFFHACFHCLLNFFLQKSTFLKNSQEYHQSVKQFGSRSGGMFCWAPNCLQNLSAANIS